jgi:hypothetical protein
VIPGIWYNAWQGIPCVDHKLPARNGVYLNKSHSQPSIGAEWNNSYFLHKLSEYEQQSDRQDDSQALSRPSNSCRKNTYKRILKDVSSIQRWHPISLLFR